MLVSSALVEGIVAAMSEPSPKRRWYHLSPDRLIIGLLAVEGFLFLSEQFQWFAFNEEKGYTVLIAVAAVCLVVVVMLLWLAASLLSRLRFQFGVRSLVVLVVAVAIPCSWLAMKMREAERQRKTVEAIHKAGGPFYYDYQPTDRFPVPWWTELSGPAWLVRLVGVDFFADVVGVSVGNTRVGDVYLEDVKALTRLDWLYLSGTQVSDAGLAHLRGLTRLRLLDLSRTQVSDAGLEHLRGRTRLKYLDLSGTDVTEEGIEELRKAIPNCDIKPPKPLITPKTNLDQD